MKFITSKWRYISAALMACAVIVFSFQNCSKGFNTGLNENLSSGLQDLSNTVGGTRYSNLSTTIPGIYMPSISTSGGTVIGSTSGSTGATGGSSGTILTSTQNGPPGGTRSGSTGGTTSGSTGAASGGATSGSSGAASGGATSGSTGAAAGGAKSGSTGASSSGGNVASFMPVIRAMNGCGAFTSSPASPVIYPLSRNACGNSQGQFVVYVEASDLVEPYVCFYRADQVETSTNPPPGKCKFAGPLSKNGNGSFVWTSTPFFATPDIQFTDYKVEVYRDRTMNPSTGYVGSVVMGLRFPELELGQKFFTTDDLDSFPERGWSSSKGNLVFYPACGGAARPGWTRYSYDVPGQEGPCYYKITVGQAPAAGKDCMFPGGPIPGYSCTFPSASAYDTKTVSVNTTISTESGTLSARCVNGEWKDVRVTCEARIPCIFPGGKVSPSCPDDFESVRAGHAARPQIQSLTNPLHNVTATCDGTTGRWQDIQVNCF